MRAAVGDKLMIRGHAIGQRERQATIVQVRGADGAPPYMVHWNDDPHEVPEEHLFFPGSDADIEHITQNT